jgi:hypothetical protein
MPTFNSTRYTAQVGSAGSSGAVNYPLAKYVDSPVYTAEIPYTVVGTEAAADLINLVKLKAGDVVIPSLCRIVNEDVGDALTLDIGFASNEDAILDGGALGTNAGDFIFTAATSGTVTAQQYVPVVLAAGDEVIYATVKTATSLTAGAKVLFIIAYKSR